MKGDRMAQRTKKMTRRTLYGANLQRRRKAVGVTQQVVASILGVTPGAIEAWEQGRNMPNPRRLAQIDAALDVVNATDDVR
jgi:transcriptional regulator with XRE-family HTH domain